MYIWWTSLIYIYIHHFEAAYKRPDVFAHPLAACRVLMHVRNTMHLQPEKANWKITVNWLIIIGYIFDNHNNGYIYIYIMDIWWISGWWLKNHLEKYESQWEGWQPIYDMENKRCLKPPSIGQFQKKRSDMVRSSSCIQINSRLLPAPVGYLLTIPSHPKPRQ